MDAIKQKMNSLRAEADQLHAENVELSAKIKAHEQDNLAKEQEITSLTHRNQVLEADLEKLEGTHKELKNTAELTTAASSNADTLTRKVQVLEDQVEKADRDLREANERLRQTDVKAGHFERKVQALEQTNASLEAKYDELEKKYKESQAELERFAAELGSL